MNHEVLKSGCGNRHCFWSYLNGRHSAFESFQVDHSLTQSNFITGMPWIAWSFARCLKKALCRHLKGSLYAVLPHTLSRELQSPKVFLIWEVQQAFPHFPLYTLAGKLSQDSKLEKRSLAPHIRHFRDHSLALPHVHSTGNTIVACILPIFCSFRQRRYTFFVTSS